jgi:hypothetical protein
LGRKHLPLDTFGHFILAERINMTGGFFIRLSS